MDDYVQIPDSNSIDFGSQDFSISYWVKFNSSIWAYPIVKRQSSTGYELQVYNNIISWYLRDSTSYASDNKDIKVFGVGTWANVVVVFDKSNNQVLQYYNGSRVGTAPLPDLGDISNDLILAIGGRALRNDGWANGFIDEISIFNRAIAEEEVSYLFLFGDSYNTNHGLCGLSNGANMVSTPSENLCLYGVPSIVSGDGPWTWTCTGLSATVSCSANKIEDGVCGSSSNIEHASIPSTNLCLTGTASTVTGDGVPYLWTCNGINGGNSVSCEATKTGWINIGLGFYVMKYEAKIQGNEDGNQTYNSTFVPESRASGTPWANISQTDAITECASLGSGYHLITNDEWTSLARHIAAQASNWSTGSVGSGILSRGYSASNSYASDGFTNTVPAPTTGTANDIYNVGANILGSTGTFTLKRTHNLANGNIVWDLAGNVYDWNSDTCTQGSGEGNWYNSGAWIDWDNTNLSDYELGRAGPNPLYTSVQNSGKYYGCSVNGNGLFRGGYLHAGAYSGIFTFYFNYSSSFIHPFIGFRCTR